MKENSENTLISIIIPVYNVEEFIDKCIKSVINQTYKDLEIILVDDGSPDNCGNICDKYAKEDQRIKVIHKENGGLSDARNIGIHNATGKYITFIDSDDYVELDYIEYLYGLIQKYNVDISFCGYTVCYENRKHKTKALSKEYKYSKMQAYKEILYAKNFEVSAWAKMYLTEHFKDICYPKGKIFEDNDTTYKLIDKNEFVAVGFESKYNYMIRTESITKKEFTEKQLYLIEASDHMCNYLSKYKQLSKAVTRKRCVARISTFNRMINASNRNRKEEEKLRKEILSYKKVIFDLESSTRDKISIIVLFLGTTIYKKIWNIYEKITGRN